MNKVFVYGSLKKGFTNNRLLENDKFICETRTAGSKFEMVSLTGFPGVKYGLGSIHGELYEVSENTMLILDRLESNGHFYNREIIDLDNGDQAWMYVLLDNDYCSKLYINEEQIEDTIVYNWVRPLDIDTDWMFYRKIET